MLRNSLRATAAAAALALGLAAAPAFAQTLTDTLITAYQTSPLLDANRAALRGLDEQIPQLRAQRRPQVELRGSYNRDQQISGDVRPGLDRASDAYQAGLNAQLLLFDNGQTAAAIESARNSIAAARADLLNVEQIVLLDAVAAFMDIRRDLEFVALARNDVATLEEQLRAARDRFEVGEITRTDVSQTEARLANSRSLLTDSLGALEVSRAAYLAAVGAPARDLQPPPPLPPLPDTLEAAIAIGTSNSPEIIAARYNERAAVYSVDRARAASGPSVGAEANVNWQDFSDQGAINEGEWVGSAGITASVPLYTGGANASLVRQARSLLEQRQHELQDAGRSVIQQVTGAWTQFEVARALIVARQEQATASRVAAEGVAEEARLGARSQLDVLDADLERLRADAEVVRALRDEYVAGYNLLAAMGLLTVSHLDLGIESYNPDDNFVAVAPAPVSTPRSDTLDRIRARWE